MKKPKPEHPPMRAFALDLLQHGMLSGNDLMHRWHERKQESRPYLRSIPASSQRNFGARITALHCLRRLEKDGLAVCIDPELNYFVLPENQTQPF